MYLGVSKLRSSTLQLLAETAGRAATRKAEKVVSFIVDNLKKWLDRVC